jgi:hypothetical protein
VEGKRVNVDDDRLEFEREKFEADKMERIKVLELTKKLFDKIE